MKMMLARRGMAVRAAGAALVKMDARLSARAATGKLQQRRDQDKQTIQLHGEL